jgi:predicted RNA-binding protein with PUA-like domain
LLEPHFKSLISLAFDDGKNAAPGPVRVRPAPTPAGAVALDAPPCCNGVNRNRGSAAMAKGSFWLVKSEPAKYAFADLERDGRTVWDGVRNNQAALYLKAMKTGDQALYYHSQEGLAVVGIAEVSREAFPDPTDSAGRFVAVELRPVRALAKPVTLAEMKANPALAGMAMFRQFRLSVSPVTPEEWAEIMKMAG